MTTCNTCNQTIKHVGDGVWIDYMQSDCCPQTSELHNPSDDND